MSRIAAALGGADNATPTSRTVRTSALVSGGARLDVDEREATMTAAELANELAGAFSLMAREIETALGEDQGMTWEVRREVDPLEVASLRDALRRLQRQLIELARTLPAIAV